MSTPIETETVKITENGDDILLSTNYIEYFESYYDNILPKKVKSSKGTSPLEDKIIYHQYDHKGNQKKSVKDGSKIYYIWGYSSKHPIAKIEGYTDAELISVNSYISDIVIKSNIDTDTPVLKVVRNRS